MSAWNRRRARLVAGGLLLALLSACTSTQVISTAPEPVRQASGETPAATLLDVTIVEFATGLPEDPAAAAAVAEEKGIQPEVRRAEGRYLSFHLKDTLETSGNWGAVRVMPRPSRLTDVEVTGLILKSDGEQLEVEVEARDATNRLWFKRAYREQASKFSYRGKWTLDPFQNFYNRVANDLLEALQQLNGREKREIRRVAALRFAGDLSPHAFGDYLEARGGRVKVAQLPAEDDAMLQRVHRIRDREDLFADTLNEYYAEFYREMAPAYNDWRQFTYEESLLLREARRKARNRLLAGAALVIGGAVGAAKSETRAGQVASAGAVGGGIQVIRSGVQRIKSAEIHRESLRELSQSLGDEITPVVMEVEGRTLELTGSVDAQYEQWRELLRRIYAEETGLPTD